MEIRFPKCHQFALLDILKGPGFFCGMIDEPVTNLSLRLIRLNASEFQIISSSANLDICIEQIAEAFKKSITKSLSETVSIEFFVGVENFNFLVV